METLYTNLTNDGAAYYQSQKCLFRGNNLLLCSDSSRKRQYYITNSIEPTVTLTLDGTTYTLSRKGGVNGFPSWGGSGFYLFVERGFDYNTQGERYFICNTNVLTTDTGDLDSFYTGIFEFYNYRSYDWAIIYPNTGLPSNTTQFPCTFKSGASGVLSISQEQWVKVANSGKNEAGIYSSQSSEIEYKVGVQCWSGVFLHLNWPSSRYEQSKALYFVKSSKALDLYCPIGNTTDETVVDFMPNVNSCIQRKNGKLYIGVPNSNHYYEATGEMPQVVGDYITFTTHIPGYSTGSTKLYYQGYIIPRYNKEVQYLAEMPLCR